MPLPADVLFSDGRAVEKSFQKCLLLAPIRVSRRRLFAVAEAVDTLVRASFVSSRYSVEPTPFPTVVYPPVVDDDYGGGGVE